MKFLCWYPKNKWPNGSIYRCPLEFATLTNLWEHVQTAHKAVGITGVKAFRR